MEKTLSPHSNTERSTHRCRWATKNTSSTHQWRIVWVCPGTELNTVLYQLQLLVAAWWHSAGVKKLLSHFHGTVWSHGWVLPCSSSMERWGIFSPPQPACAVFALSAILHGGSFSVRGCHLSIAMAHHVPWITPKGCGTRGLRGWRRGTAQGDAQASEAWLPWALEQFSFLTALGENLAKRGTAEKIKREVFLNKKN